jgi:hypothetical protein
MVSNIPSKGVFTCEGCYPICDCHAIEVLEKQPIKSSKGEISTLLIGFAGLYGTS